ncbi:MAG: metallophosphoesterase family protein [Clostridiales bacterium]|nr:metallophosphoesterase family protein [Clostridiales bacterium]
MRKIGVITDIHGNLAALTAVLDLLDREGCEEIIHTGDVVDIGPHSRECLELLLSRQDVTCLLGNHDRDFADNQTQVRNLSHVPSEHKQQVFATLTEELRRKVKSFPVYVTRDCGGSRILFCHYAFNPMPLGIDQYLFKPIDMYPTAEAFDALFDGVEADAVFFGHKHEPCDIKGNRLYVDVGSVGCHPQPLARAVVIEYDDTTWSYRRICAPYDMDSTKKDMLNEIKCGQHLYDFYFMLNTKK